MNFKKKKRKASNVHNMLVGGISRTTGCFQTWGFWDYLLEYPLFSLKNNLDWPSCHQHSQSLVGDQKEIDNLLEKLELFALDERRNDAEFLLRVLSECNKTLMRYGLTNLRMIYDNVHNCVLHQNGSQPFHFPSERQSREEIKNKTLILDLDETIVHTQQTPSENINQRVSVGNSEWYVGKRPFLDEFLQLVRPSYQTVIWSTGSPEYIIAVTNALGITDQFLKLIGKNIHRINDESIPKKDIRKKGFSPKTTLIVDDEPEKFRSCYGNGIKIRGWNGDLQDRELLSLADYLKVFENIADVRTVDKRAWENRKMVKDR